MKKFTTAVSLTEKQVMDLAAMLFKAHYNSSNLNPAKREKITNDLFILLTQPVGSEINMYMEYASRFLLAFEDCSTGSDTVVLRVDKDQETSIPIDLVMLFLLSKRFWDFKLAIWAKWKFCLGKPLPIEHTEDEQARIKDQSINVEPPKVIGKIDWEELSAFYQSRLKPKREYPWGWTINDELEEQARIEEQSNFYTKEDC
jgi:hypothetical protein